MATFIAPQTMFAASTTTVATKRFCTNLDTYLATSEKKMAEREVKQDSSIAKRQAQLATNRAEKDKKVADARAQILLKQDEKLNSALAKATSTEQKLAITEFRNAVKSAIEVRQKAIDDARNVYRGAVDKIVTDRKANTNNALTAMKSAIETAVAKAKTDCSNGLDVNTVKSDLKQSVQNARNVFKNSIQNLGKINDSIKSVATTKQASFDKAHTDFKTALETAKTNLKAKLGK